jgi:hypothetical protein
MWSTIDYDPNLKDPFFKPNESSDALVCDDGVGTYGVNHKVECCCNSKEGLDETRLHRFCEARVIDGHNIALRFYDPDRGHERGTCLMVWMRKGRFTMDYQGSNVYGKSIRLQVRWIPQKQKLTLDKRAYRKGEVIKGRIEFECLKRMRWRGLKQEKTRTFKIFRVFKAILR